MLQTVEMWKILLKVGTSHQNNPKISTHFMGMGFRCAAMSHMNNIPEKNQQKIFRTFYSLVPFWAPQNKRAQYMHKRYLLWKYIFALKWGIFEYSSNMPLTCWVCHSVSFIQLTHQYLTFPFTIMVNLFHQVNFSSKLAFPSISTYSSCTSTTCFIWNKIASQCTLPQKVQSATTNPTVLMGIRGSQGTPLLWFSIQSNHFSLFPSWCWSQQYVPCIQSCDPLVYLITQFHSGWQTIHSLWQSPHLWKIQ